MQVAKRSSTRSVSAPTKSLLVVAAVLGALAFLGIIEFGISAGRVHHGVTAGGFDVGGLTLNEAQDFLVDRVHEVRDVPACLDHDAILLCVDPAEVGWRPEPRATGQQAYDVGRTDGLLGALGDRATAWVGGVSVPWRGGPNGAKVGGLLDEWESIFDRRGLKLRRFAARREINKALDTYPRDTLAIPIHDASR
jgi:hypothetical protein